MGAAPVGARLSAPRWRPRGSGRSIYVVGGFVPGRPARPRRWSATTSARRRWARVRSMPVRLNHPTAVLRGRLYVHGGYAGARPVRAHRVLLRYDPAHEPLAAAAARAHAAGRARRGGDRDRLYVAGGANDSGSLRSLEVYDFERAALAQRAGASRAARATTRPAWPRRALLRAGRPRRARTSPWPSATTRARRRWERLPRHAHPARRHRLGAAARRPHRGVRRRGARRRAARRSPRSSCSTRARGAGARLPDMRTPRHGLGGAALGGRVFAVEGGPQPGFPFSRALEFLDVPRASVAARVPAQGRHPHAALPDPDGRDHRDLRDRLLRLRARPLGARRQGNERVLEYGAIPLEITHPGRDCASVAGVSSMRGRPGGSSPPTRRPGGSRSSPRCSCTAACSTSAATCCSCGSSGTTSRTRWAGSASWRSTCSAGSRRSGAGARRPGLGGARRSGRAARSRRCSAATRCSIRARGW